MLDAGVDPFQQAIGDVDVNDLNEDVGTISDTASLAVIFEV